LVNYRKDGTEFWVDFSLIPIWKEGKLTNFVSIQRDTTQKKHYTLMISSLLDALPAQVALVDEHGTIKVVNQEWKNHCLKGNFKEHETVIGKKYIETCAKIKQLNGLDFKEIEASLQDVIEGKKAFFVKEFQNMAEKKSFELKISPLKPIHPSDVVIFCLDISDRVKVKTILEESSLKLNSILESITDGFFAMDNKFEITYFNKEAERLLNTKREDMLGMNLWKIFPEGKNLSFYQMYMKVLDQKVPVHFEEYYSPGKIWMEVNAYPSEEGLIVYFKDITKKKHSEEKILEYTHQLEKVNNELDQFVYRTSHDLRAPLVSILGLISIYRMENEERKREEYLDMMVRSINKLDTFIQDIIYYSKNTRTEIIPQRVDFKTLFEETIDNFKFMEEAREIQFILPDKYPKIEFCTDINRLSVILNNFISNAIRYRDPNKNQLFVKIALDIIPGNTVRLSIEDNGLGIAEKDQERIFEMFYRANQNATGSGLGLYIVSENLKKINGTIIVKSKIGKGTTFIVDLPDLSLKRGV
jgi:PAS domain S-box-containing protein